MFVFDIELFDEFDCVWFKFCVLVGGFGWGCVVLVIVICVELLSEMVEEIIILIL